MRARARARARTHGGERKLSVGESKHSNVRVLSIHELRYVRPTAHTHTHVHTPRAHTYTRTYTPLQRDSLPSIDDTCRGRSIDNTCRGKTHVEVQQGTD